MAEEEGFTVRDRRTGASDTGAEQPQQGSGTDARKPSGLGNREALHEAQPSQDLDFSTFVISLATSAQVGLGAVPHPETNQAVQNFPAAKQMIDIIALLKEKTKGNLTEAESSLLDQVLYNLRIHYVRAMEGQKKSGG
jgi:hypothetical protein